MQTMRQFKDFADALDAEQMAEAVAILARIALRKRQETRGVLTYDHGVRNEPSTCWMEAVEQLDEARQKLDEIAVHERAERTPAIIGKKDD